jgi:hypothetical protein
MSSAGVPGRSWRWAVIGLTAVVVGVAGAAYAYRTGGIAEPIQMVLGIAGGTALMVAITVWGLRRFTRNRDAHNQAADRHDAALKQIARREGWAWVPGTDYSHAMIGTFRGWGQTGGSRDGMEVQVAVDIESDSDGPNVMKTVILVKPPAGRRFDLRDQKKLALERKKGSLDPRREAPIATHELDPLLVRLDVTPDLFKATLAPPDRYFRSMSYILAVQPDVDAISTAVAACMRTASTLLSRS